MKPLGDKSLPFSEVDALALAEDRRWNERNKLLKNVRILQMDPTRGEEIGTVVDISRDGLYFTAQSAEYQIGMPLRLIVPDAKTACTCEVVRTELLPGGRTGVGVRVFAWESALLQ
jgi:hypothetical protein